MAKASILLSFYVHVFDINVNDPFSLCISRPRLLSSPWSFPLSMRSPAVYQMLLITGTQTEHVVHQCLLPLFVLSKALEKKPQWDFLNYE